MTGSTAWLSFAVSTILALISIAFNIWQHYKYRNQTEALRGCLSAWWHWAIAIRDHIDMYWDAAGKSNNPDTMLGIGKGTIDGLAKYSSRLADDIAKRGVYLGFPAPWEEPW